MTRTGQTIMTTAEARKIVESLADGRCPTTGQPLADTYQEPDVIRALFLAVRALEQLERIERQRKTLPDRAGQPWEASEDQQLCEEFDAGKTVAEIAQVHQRTRGAVESRLERLGRILPQQR